MTKADIKYRPISPVRQLGFWVTMILSGLLWLAAIFWMLLHVVTGPR